MSSASAAARHRRRRIAAGLLGLWSLAACGFEPMYGEPRGVAVHNELQTVRVGLIANRQGQQLRRYILERIHSSDDAPAALYQLDVGIIENRAYYGIQRDLTATYARLQLTGAYTLRDVKTQQPVLTGSVNVYSSYNVAADPFNTVVAESDARERAVRNLGDELILRVSAFLRATPRAAPAPS